AVSLRSSRKAARRKRPERACASSTRSLFRPTPSHARSPTPSSNRPRWRSTRSSSGQRRRTCNVDQKERTAAPWRRQALRAGSVPHREDDGATPPVAVGDPGAVPARSQPRPRLRRLGFLGAALATLSGGAWASHDWWTVGRYVETTDDAYVGGNVTAIAPHVSGFVAQVLAADNERVHTGQVLVRLDPRDFQAALDHAAAVVAARTT